MTTPAIQAFDPFGEGADGSRLVAVEGYATAFENAWRRTVMGETSIRSGYFFDGDIGYIPPSELFPPQ